MLVIRSVQLAAFEGTARESFERMALAHVCEVFPEAVQAMGAAAASAQIRRSIDRAAGFEITAREDVLLFLDLDFEMGEPFEDHGQLRWVARILHNRSVPSRMRMRRIYDRLLAEGEAG